MPDGPDIRFVVFHRPGPAWRPGVDFRLQPGVMDHVRHYAELHARGLLDMGGPFPAGEHGGMMIPVAGLSETEVAAFARADPAVEAGLLVAEVRPWMVAMRAGEE